ncbi:peptidyl-prolyl cis-trans isomerase FKBP17-1, chloroplastic-like isoform X1 [Chenopodium quinoa]|uniref:peptidyl-prolyl cis-trans isomerase FKBP17-1, chloroplastic-like isoform X1 n=1 Tax=Chenopodium quinoa TaxID=63459 RepID=UPI000B78740F|nr:peptidyl-prolyl cis-trans isomerase FKBP17-1, chloroplastic-like isoform X1 [Chenopodium quinoa]
MTMISFHVPHHLTIYSSALSQQSKKISIISSSSSPLVKQPTSSSRRLLLSTCIITSIISPATFFSFSAASFSSTPNNSSDAIGKFYELPNSGGVKALDLRVGTGSIPVNGDKVAIHYYGRLAAKQGWRFDSTYDHKDPTGEPIPFIFILGSNNVISGIEGTVRSMKVGGIRRVIIPPSQGYQNTTQEPLPPNFFDRQRLFTTIFNPTRLANGEGSTLGTLIFDVELVNVKH